MSDEDRRVATLAALFAPERARSLLGRLGEPENGGEPEYISRLTTASRRDRLEALAVTLAIDAAAVRDRAEAAASGERPPLAAILRALGVGGVPPAATVVLLRLCRERLGC